jgi:hypothetical protein
MGKKIDITNKKFNKLTALNFLRKENGQYIWLFQCDCGNKKELFRHHVVGGTTKSCGCWAKERTSTLNKSHGLRKHPLYYIWRGMKIRCYNKNAPFYKNLGGRGIIICDEWKSDFQAFYAWANNNGWQKGLILDRIDVNKHYEPNNCRFVTPKESSNNKTNNVKIYYHNKCYTVQQMIELLDLNPHKFRKYCLKYSLEISIERSKKI